MILPAILSSGIAAISIIITIIIIVLLFLWKFKQKSEQNDQISIKWTIPFIIVILLSICLIGTTIGTKYENSEENMDDIVMDIMPIIQSARQRLNSVDLKRYDLFRWSNNVFRDKFEADSGIDSIRKNVRLGGYKDFVHKKDTLAIRSKKWIRLLIPNNCTYRIMAMQSVSMMADTHSFEYETNHFFDDKVAPLLNSLESYHGASLGSYRIFKDDRSELKHWQRKYAKSKTGEGINMRQKMLDNFELAMNNTQITRREWVEKMMEKLPDKQNIIKKTIILSCIINIILSAISILIIIFGQKLIGKKILGKVAKILVLVIGLVSIVISIVVIILSLDIFEKCSLNEENFGINDFLSPLPGNESITICQSRDLSFYADLGNDTEITFEELFKDFEKKKDEYRSMILSPLHKLTIPQSYTTQFDNVNDAFGRINYICNNQCYPNETVQVCGYRDLIKGIVDGYENIVQPMVENFNKFLENPNQITINAIDWETSKMFETFKNVSINLTQEEILATDFPCSLLVDKFVNTGRSICQQLDIPIDIFYIYLTLLVGLFIGHLIINTMMLKYSLKENGTPDSHNKSTSQQSPSNNV